MFLIECPYCGPREQSDYRYGGEIGDARPEPPQTASDAAWGAFLFQRSNPKGTLHERWFHASGCRRWFCVVRSTANDRIHATYRLSEAPPEIAAEAPVTPSGEVAGSGNDAVKLISAGTGDTEAGS